MMSRKGSAAHAVTKKKRPASEGIVAGRPAASVPSLPSAPADAASWKRTAWYVTIGLAGLSLIIAVLAMSDLGQAMGQWLGVTEAAPEKPTPRQRTPQELRRAEAESTPQGRICLKFADRINAGELPPPELLGPTPGVPGVPVTPEEAERLDSEFILRSRYRVEEVRPLARVADQPPRFVLVLKGGVTSAKFAVRTPNGEIEEGQRVMSNPDVIVEVQGETIFGVKARLHRE
jgi:hypothetical protein